MKKLILGSYGDIQTLVVPEKNHHYRLDAFLHDAALEHSRSYFQKLISDGIVLVNGIIITKSSYRVKTGDRVEYRPEQIDFTRSCEAIDTAMVHDLGVSIIAQEPDFLIINKPAGLVVHKPSHAHRSVTLVDWLLSVYPLLEHIGDSERPGIVHRLDMQTSGLMIIPRTAYAHALFTQMFKDRLIKKTYYALITGHPSQDTSMDYRIMRHPTQRTKMAASKSQGRHALTHFNIIEYLRDATFIKASPETGRTHQIRVHCAAWGFPILGDIVYGKSSSIINRHALHAAELHFDYQGKPYHFSAPLPDDMVNAQRMLRLV